MIEPRATPESASASDRTAGPRRAVDPGRDTQPSRADARSRGRAANRPAPSESERRGTSLGHIRAVVDAVPEAVLVMEPGGELRFTNPAADRLFADQPVVDRDDLLSRFERVGLEPAAPSAIADRPDARGTTVIARHRSRPTRWFAIRTVPLAAEPDPAQPQTPETDAEPADASTAFVLRDVTDTRDLRPIREAFLGLVSHELRTPITTIYAGSSVLAREPSLSPPATRALALDVSTEAARLYDLVEDLLVLARIERGVLDPLDEPVLLDRVVESTIRLATERHPNARIQRGSTARRVTARGDATYLDQAARNIVLATIRRPGQVPEPEVEIVIRIDGHAGLASVAVLDRGPAVADAELERMFDLPDASVGVRQPAGGLGLFIARELVESMGGRAWAVNRPGGGLEIGFDLRLDRRA